MKSGIFILSLFVASAAFADSDKIQDLTCNLETTIAGAPIATLEISADLSDASKTIINGTQVSRALPQEVASQLNAAMIIQWNQQQLTMTKDLSKLYSKDVASYNCTQK